MTHQTSLFSLTINKTERISFLSELRSQEDLLLFKHSHRPSDNQHLFIHFAFRRPETLLEDNEPVGPVTEVVVEIQPDPSETDGWVFSLSAFHHVLFTRLTKRILYTGNACDCELLSSNVGEFIYFKQTFLICTALLVEGGCVLRAYI